MTQHQQEMTCAYVQDNALGLCSLLADDPERVAAHSHARARASCAAALADGARSLALVDAQVHAEAIASPNVTVLLQRVRASIKADELQHAMWQRVALAAFVGQGVALVGVYRPETLSNGIVVALLSLVALLGVWHGTKNNGRRGLQQAAALVALSSFAAALAQPWRGDLHVEWGIHCLRFEVACAIVPWSVAGFALWRGFLSQGQRTLAVHGMAASLVGQALLLRACPVEASAIHAIAFHCTGLVVAMLAGYGLGAFIEQLRLRAQPSSQ